MAKLNKDTLFKPQRPKSETTLDKTSRIALKMVDDEAEQRRLKNARLRKTRLEREAHSPTAAKSAASKAATRK